MDLIERCRLCAKLCNQNGDYLFNDENQNFLDLIAKYISIHISSDDHLPLFICETCKSTLKSFDEYVLRCHDTQNILGTFNKSGSLDEKVAFKIEIKEEDLNYGQDSEELIKTENDVYYNEDFANEDCLPLIETIHANRKTRSKYNFRKKKPPKEKVKKSVKCKSQKKSKSENDVKIDQNNAKKIGKKSIDKISSHEFFNFFCHVCKEDCKNFPELRKHVSSSHSERAYVTCVCSKNLHTRQNLFQHLMKHLDGFGIKCQICTKKFRTEIFYNRHMKTHDRELKCTHCSKVFITRDSLKSHERIHLPAEERAMYSCDICHLKFLSKYTVSIHKQTIHDKYKPFICDECGKNFVTVGALSAHKVVHQNIATIPCPQCPKKFKSKARLKRHTDYHNGVSYKCPECSILFNNKRTLTEHFYTHRDVYRFACGYCDKKFKWKSSFTSHVNNHTGATPFKCDWCPKTFSDGPNCRIHKKRRHPVELAEYDAKRAANNPKTKRSAVPIIRDVVLKEPIENEMITFPANNACAIKLTDS